MSVKKVLLNKNNTGFGLSKEAHELFLKKANIPFTKHTENFKTILLKTSALNYEAALTNARDGKDLEEIRKTYIHHCSEIPRDHEALWEVADFLGMERMNDRFSKLEFVEIPEDRLWSIKEIDGIEYISINPNPIPKFNGKCDNWYASDFRPPWMDPKNDSVVVVGTTKNGNITSTICSWGNICYNLMDLIDYKWYPLTKLCPLYCAK
jgi:hypothetical protein